MLYLQKEEMSQESVDEGRMASCRAPEEQAREWQSE